MNNRNKPTICTFLHGMKITNSALNEATLSTDLLRRALNENWQIPTDRRAALLDEQLNIASDPTISAGVRCAAFDNVLKCCALNLKSLDTIAKLGLTAALTQPASRSVASDDEINAGLAAISVIHETEEPETLTPEAQPWKLAGNF